MILAGLQERSLMAQPILNLPITTERLILRNYISEDWQRVHIYGSLPDFSQFEVWGPNTLDDTHNFIVDKVNQIGTTPRFKFDFAVCLKDSNLLIKLQTSGAPPL